MGFLDAIIYCYENITPFQASMLLSAILLYVLYLSVRDMDVPPGPKGVPLLGYWPFLKPDTCHLQLTELMKKYGDVFSIRVAGTLFIHLGSLKSTREAHLTKGDNFERFTGDSVLSATFGDSVAFINGEQWQVLRKFFITKLREFGMNTVKENLVSTVYDSLKESIEELHKSKGSPIAIGDMITTKSMMVIRRILFNDQGLTEENLEELTDLYREITKVWTGTNMLLIGTFPKYFMFPFMPAYWNLKSYVKRMDKIFTDATKQHQADYNESDIADLIDSYFKERDDRQKKGDPTAKYFTDRALVSSLSQFVTDGGMTVAVLVENIFLKLVERSEEQGKIYQEIIEVIGTDRLPTLEDKTKLPYTNAFIYEVMRYTDFLPLFTSVQCTKETTVNGYKIPVGAITLQNFYSSHRNPLDFENADEFNPSRYLPSSEKKRPDLPVLFGIGKRSCIGEAFSMNQTFLYLTTIVQNFRITLPEGTDTKSAMWWSAEKFRICAHPRSHKSH